MCIVCVLPTASSCREAFVSSEIHGSPDWPRLLFQLPREKCSCEYLLSPNNLHHHHHPLQHSTKNNFVLTHKCRADWCSLIKVLLACYFSTSKPKKKGGLNRKSATTKPPFESRTRLLILCSILKHDDNVKLETTNKHTHIQKGNIED